MDAIQEMRLDVRMSSKDVAQYYLGFRYWAGAGEIKGLELFRSYMASGESRGDA